MKKIFVFLIIFVITGSLVFLSFKDKKTKLVSQVTKEPFQETTSNISSPKIIAENLDTPWAIAFLPGGDMLVAERPGRVRFINSEGIISETPVVELNNVKEIGEGGLLGIAIHPNFSTNNFIYLYYTYSGDNNRTFNRIVRMVYKDKRLIEEKIIIDKIPGAPNHNGGRIKFGPDGFLYITTGDAQNPSQAQDINSLAGKILRVNDDGGRAPGNPFNNLVFSYGHRNPQGLAWDSDGNLWATEHGRSGVLSGLDEINLIRSGKNYGWPIIQGDDKKDGMEKPILHSGSDTWAPSGAAFVGSSLFFAGLRGQALYRAVVDKEKIQLNKHFKNKYGRIREVILGPDSMLYITTSNNDGRGSPDKTDDKVIKIDPKSLN